MIDFRAIFLAAVLVAYLLMFAAFVWMWRRAGHLRRERDYWRSQAQNWQRHAKVFEDAFWSGKTPKEFEQAIKAELAKINGKAKHDA